MPIIEYAFNEAVSLFKTNFITDHSFSTNAKFTEKLTFVNP